MNTEIIIEDKWFDADFLYRGKFGQDEFTIRSNSELTTVEWDDPLNKNQETEDLILEKYFNKWQ